MDLTVPLQRVLASHWYILGSELTAFEREFADYCGVPECVGVANGTDALELALRALGVGAGDRVLVTANAGFYGSTAVRAAGATPIYAEVDGETLTLAPEALAAGMAQAPKAIIVTHLYGRLAAIEDLVGIAAEHGVPVIEDCAQAHGAERGGRRAGSFGAIGCFSFYPTKNLGAIGDGGAIVTKEPATAETLRRLRQYGWGRKYSVELPGGCNSRLDELQAAVLRTKLPHLDKANAERRAIAERYNQAFTGLPLRLPQWQGGEYVAHLYTVRLEQRDAFRAFLGERGIATDIHYPIPDYAQAAYPVAGSVELPETERACREIVSLPCFPGLAETEVRAVIEAVRAWFERQPLRP